MCRVESCLDECIGMYLKLWELCRTSIITHRQRGRKSLMQSLFRQEYSKEQFTSLRILYWQLPLPKSTVQAGDFFLSDELYSEGQELWKRKDNFGPLSFLQGLRCAMEMNSRMGSESPRRIPNGFLVWLLKVSVFSVSGTRDYESWFSIIYRIKF